jgi:hypothetical protein
MSGQLPSIFKLSTIATVVAAIAPLAGGQQDPRQRRPSAPPPPVAQPPATATPAKPTAPADYVKWESPDKAFSLSHPKGWEPRKSQVPGAPLMFVNLAEGEPPADRPDELTKRGMLMVFTLPSGNPPNFERWCEGVKKALLAKALNPQVVEEKTGTIAGQPAMRIVFDTQLPDNSALRFVDWFFYKGPTAYALTYTVDAARYDQFAPVEQAITDSFKPGAAARPTTVAAGGNGPPALRPTAFEQKDLGLKLTYPAGWGVANVPAKEGVVLSLGKHASAGKLVQILTVMAQALEPNETVTLKEMETKLSEMAQAGLKNAKTVEATDVKVGGEPARRIVFAGVRPVDDHEIRTLFAFALHNRATYGLLASGPVEDYDTLKADFDATLATFAFAPAGGAAAATAASDAPAKSGQPAAAAPTAAGATAFESPTAGLKLSYPANWTARKSADPTILLMLSSPAKTGARPGTLMITAEPIAQGDKFDPKAQVDSAVAALKGSTLPDAKVIESTDVRIGRETARRVLIGGHDSLKQAESRNLYVVLKNADQTITFTGQSTLADFNALNDAVDAILPTIELSPPTKKK